MLTQLVHTPVHEHRCPRCGTAFDLNHVVELTPRTIVLDDNGEGAPQTIQVTVMCSACPQIKTLTFPLKSPPLERLLKEFHRENN